MKKAKAPVSDDPVQRELDAIKRLLILLLLKSGATAADVARAMNVQKSRISEMMPTSSFGNFEWIDK